MYQAIIGNDPASWLRSLRDSTPSTLHTPTATTPLPEYCENNSAPSLRDFAISPKGSSESHSSRTSKLRKRARAEENKAAGRWWWYWEIGACLLSILFMGLLVIFLVKIDLKSRSLWRLGVEPNTVVAIFATLIKTSMMVSVVSCVSQLKWHHFKTKDRPLHHLDIIDDCSRGPWGSLILLLRNPRANPIISAFAVITIIGLGIEPSAQQLLETRQRVVALRNASAEIDMALSWSSSGLRTHDNFSSPEFRAQNMPWPHVLPAWDFSSFLRFHASLLGGISQPPSTPHFRCLTDNCSWPDFTTLAVCSRFQDLTDEIQLTRTCSEPRFENNKSAAASDRGEEEGGGGGEDDVDVVETWFADCVYTFPSAGWPASQLYATFSNSSTLSIHQERSYNSTAFRKSSIYANTTFGVISYRKFGYQRVPPSTDQDTTQAYAVELYPCAQTFINVSVAAGKLSIAEIHIEALVHPADMGRASSYTGVTSNSHFAVEFGLHWRTFGVFLPQWLDGRPASNESNVAGRTSRYRDLGINNWVWLSDSSKNASDLERSFQNIATTLSSLMQSTAAPGSFQDNNMATVLRGHAFGNESYINVRFPWLVVILMEVLLTMALLVWSIDVSLKDPLLKTSVFAFLVHGLDGWENINVPDPETAETLASMAENMIARLKRVEEGGIKFARR